MMKKTEKILFEKEIEKLKKNKSSFNDIFNYKFFDNLDKDLTKYSQGLAIRFPLNLFDFKKLLCSEYVKVNTHLLSKNNEKKFIKGDLKIEDKIDLHNMNVEQAADYLSQFIIESLMNQYKVIQVITGKNLHSNSQYPIIKTYVYHWLSDLDYVLAFCSSDNQNGGTGSYFLYLKNIYKV